jgi:hypothetical protein
VCSRLRRSITCLDFFDIDDGYRIDDADGTELADTYTAQAAAIRLSGEILRDLGAKFWNGALWKLTVSDEQRRVLFILRFSAEEMTNGSSRRES